MNQKKLSPNVSPQVTPPVKIAIIPLLVLVALLAFNIILFGDSATSGANQIALIIASMVTALLNVFVLKMDYQTVEAGAVKSIQVSLQAILILLLVGSLIGLWILAGIVPTMIYYGIGMINPTFFLPVACIVCSIVSVATGSSWSTAGTVGIALIGIGIALQIPVEMVAGAIISGAYFGDKMSPLSETTNLAPAVSGAELFSHIRHMLYSTTPAYCFSLIGFLVLGFFYGGAGSEESSIVPLVLSTLKSQFNISLWTLIVPLIVFFLVIKKTPAIPALLFGCLLGGVMAFFAQGEALENMSGGNLTLSSSYKIILETSYAGFKSNSGEKILDDLLSGGGMAEMLPTVWLILCAMVFGGMMEVSGMLGTLANSILKLVRGTTGLVAATISSSFLLNLTASDQYLSIVVSGRMFQQAYKKFGLASKNLSRALEDGGTVTSVLIPWNTCGAYFAGVLNVATLSYLPYCFFNIASPICSIGIAALGISMTKLSSEVASDGR